MQEHDMSSNMLEIDLDSLQHNIKIAAEKIGGISRIIAVVKADAYNHGAVQIADKLSRCGIEIFAVANLDEAIMLRETGIKGTVLVFGPVFPEHLHVAAERDISITVECLDALVSARDFVLKTNKQLKIHIALNTGMNRIGFYADGSLSDELSEACHILRETKGLMTEGIYSHFCDADDKESDFCETQYKRFDDTVRVLGENGISFSMRHISNSAGFLTRSGFECDKVRLGIGMYGCEIETENLIPILSFRTHILQVFDVKKGETVGYARTYTAEKNMRVATIAAGYADGLNRLLSDRGEVVVRGKRAPIIGRICMDLSMIDVTDIPESKSYDMVTIIGKDGNEHITAEEHARLCGTISYEILCNVGKRAKRIYTEK